MTLDLDIPLSGCPVAASAKIQLCFDANPKWEEPDGKRHLIVIGLDATPRDRPLVYEKPDPDFQPSKAPKLEVPEWIDKLCGGMLSQHLDSFAGSEGTWAVIPLPANCRPFTGAAVVGLGSADRRSRSPEICAAITGDSTAAAIRQHRAQVGDVWLAEGWELTPDALGAFVATLLPLLTSDTRFKSAPSAPTPLEALRICLPPSSAGLSTEYSAALSTARRLAQGIQLARELIAAPPNYCTPVALARVAVNIAEQFHLKSEVLGPDELKKLQMTSFLAVAQGSSFPAQLVHLTYISDDVKDGAPPKKRMALVGKGITMDTGGYNLKSMPTIDYMKVDMGGAAAVLGVARAIGAIRPPGMEIHFIAPLAENMISAAAYRPGDIITASNGRTIEVQNTDAEGRLILCDALIFAQRLGVPLVVDCATLTGACMVALGDQMSAVYSNDNELQAKIVKLAGSAGERMWPMPLNHRMRHLIDSKIADLTNMPTSPAGGSISAALFLHEFIDPSVKWAHIDMVGPVFSASTRESWGHAVRTLTALVMEEE